MLNWTNPQSVDISKGVGFLYFVRIVDRVTNVEYRYVGQSREGKSRLNAYCRNVRRIRKQQPRRSTHGQEKYRAVHLALAKADEFGWEYEFYPLENVEPADLNEAEKLRVREFDCNLNSGTSWSVADYHSLSIGNLLLVCDGFGPSRDRQGAVFREIPKPVTRVFSVSYQ